MKKMELSDWHHTLKILGFVITGIGLLIGTSAYLVKQRINALDEIKSKEFKNELTPENITKAQNILQYKKFKQALEESQSIDIYFPNALEFDFTEKDYELITNSVKSTDSLERITKLLKLLFEKFKDKSRKDNSLAWYIVRDFRNISNDWNRNSKEIYLNQVFENYAKNHNSKNGIILLRLMHILNQQTEVNGTNVFCSTKHLASKYKEPKERNCLRKLLTDTIPDEETPYWGTPLAYHHSPSIEDLRTLNNIEKNEKKE